MFRSLGYFVGGAVIFGVCILPTVTLAETVRCVNSYSVYQVKTYTLPPNTLDPGPNQHNSLSTNAAAAQGDIGKTFFTSELTSFNDVNCAGGQCKNNIPGIAHRTWPLNSCVVVCNSQNQRCAVAIVMDRGPNTRLGCRTIDANPALQTVLAMRGGNVPATYQLRSLPPTRCELIPVNISADAPSVSITRSGSPFSNLNQATPVGFSSIANRAVQPSAASGVSPAPAFTPGSANYPLPQPIPVSSLLTASQVDSEQAAEEQIQSKNVSDLLNALAAPTSSANAFSRAPLTLTGRVSAENVSGLVAGNAPETSSGLPPVPVPLQSTNTFMPGYRSPDLRWSAWDTASFFRPFFLEIESMIRSILDLIREL